MKVIMAQDIWSRCINPICQDNSTNFQTFNTYFTPWDDVAGKQFMFWYGLQSALILHTKNIFYFLLGPLRWRSSCPRSIYDAAQWMKAIYDAARWMNTTSENMAITQAYKWFLWFGLKHLFHRRRLAEEFHWASNISESLRLGNITNTQCK